MPRCGPGVRQGQEPGRVQAFPLQLGIERPDERVARRLARLGEVKLYLVQVGPVVEQDRTSVSEVSS